jgi:hypothetical protein
MLREDAQGNGNRKLREKKKKKTASLPTPR